MLTLLVSTASFGDAPTAAPRVNNFPTLARVEYVQECINRTGGRQTSMYQCACVVDRIAESMNYDEFVESTTFARYATLPGEGGGLFRDTDEAKEKARLFRATEAKAFRACNLPVSAASNGPAPATPAATSSPAAGKNP